jgi:1-phosphofructokinase family hexose kinase
MENREITGVLTLTLNPCFDLTLTLDKLDEDDVNRVSSELCESAGKAMHVSCVLSRFGIKSCALIVAGESSLETYRAGLPAGDYEVEFITAGGRIRENMTLCPPGRCLKINRLGFACTPETVDKIAAALERRLTPGMLLVVSGSWPKGFEVRDFLRISKLAEKKGARIALDAGHLNLAELCEIRPWLVKPNEHELAALTGLPAKTKPQRDKALEALHGCGISKILLSLGPRGLLLSADGEQVEARVPEVEVRSTVGAGDSSLAGFLYGCLSGLPSAECVRHGAAFGTATVTLPATGLVTRELAEKFLPLVEVASAAAKYKTDAER